MLPSSSPLIPIKNGINFRDLGGIITQDGRQIRPGCLFRSGDFYNINATEQHFIADSLGLKNVLDYRDQTEAEARPDNLWQHAHYFNIPANPFSDEVTATLTKELTHSGSLKKHSPLDFMVKLYQLLPFNNPAYQKLVHLLLNHNGQSIVQHCAIGKDRTGVGVALTLFTLGVDEQTIMQDYLLSDHLLNDFRQHLFEQYKDKLTTDELINRQQIFAAKPIYLQSAIDAIKSKYGTVDGWLENEYQLTEKNRQIIKNYYLI